MKTIAITELTEIEAIIRKCPYCTVGITDLDVYKRQGYIDAARPSYRWDA